MSAARSLLIMAAGTGGHIIPGLAIAAEMRARGWRVEWLGTSHGMENRLVPPAGILMHAVDFSGLRGKGWRHTVTGVFKLVRAALVSRALLRRRQPDVVLGMGGYVTVPGGWAAGSTGVPLVLVNADAALLLSNRALAKAARRVLFGFEGDYGALVDKARCTGNPVRSEISNSPAPALRMAGRSGALRLLVVGGSLGARVLNETVPQALALIPQEARPQVTHQSGAGNAEALRAAYDRAGVIAEVVEFIDDMPRRYGDADVVLCRAGAITVSELTAAGVASVLVPLVVSTTSHQRDNAAWLASHGGAVHLPQDAMNADSLAGLLQSLERTKLLRMAEAAHALGKRDATRTIADELEQVVKG